MEINITVLISIQVSWSKTVKTAVSHVGTQMSGLNLFTHRNFYFGHAFAPAHHLFASLIINLQKHNKAK